MVEEDKNPILRWIGIKVCFFIAPLKSILDKDVARTDRDHPFFANDDNPNLILLRDILLTHTVLDPELGLQAVSFWDLLIKLVYFFTFRI